ncbi:MAG: hypothetical protein ABSH47_27005, partial [Bryobacteraceae bacterium]
NGGLAFLVLVSADGQAELTKGTAMTGLLPGNALERSRRAADASRDNIWQGNCHAFTRLCHGSFGHSNFSPLRITISEYPISHCPAKFMAASFKRLYPK